jgi:cytoskeletal protein CcmA (bactofilin family)
MNIAKAFFALSLLLVSGAHAANNTFRNITITDDHKSLIGDVEAQAALFNGSLLITGNLDARDSVFKSNITVNGAVTLSQTHTKSITVINKTESPSTSAQVKLQGRTVVDGDIRFEGEEGTVFISPEALITGKVVHGSLIIQKLTEQELTQESA